MNPAIHRQMMGHSSSAMTSLYTGQVPTDDVIAALTAKSGVTDVNRIDERQRVA
jgi:hypothetical protein